MQLYHLKKRWKFFLFIGAALISLFSLWYTNRLVAELKLEEQKKMELWAEASRQLALEEVDHGEAMALILEILRNNTTVPVILTDDLDQIVFHRNIPLSRKEEGFQLQRMLDKMKRYKEPIPVQLGPDDFQYLYYYDSTLLVKLQWFPLVQLAVVFVFMLVAYVAFSATRRREQDQVWVGMARETAHQLGTPTTSLLGWMDVLQMKEVDEELVGEMRKDIERLQTITARFSKIGSRPELSPVALFQVLRDMVGYLRRRSSTLVQFELELPQEELELPLSRPLFEWVIENLCKNAIDAIEGEGHILLKVQRQKDKVLIDVSDNGKGMSRAVLKTIFKPGYSTKLRGWGLGLTLSKRIVEQYHGGQLTVLHTAPGKGCTFRIVLPRAHSL